MHFISCIEPKSAIDSKESDIRHCTAYNTFNLLHDILCDFLAYSHSFDWSIPNRGNFGGEKFGELQSKLYLVKINFGKFKPSF